MKLIFLLLLLPLTAQAQDTLRIYGEGLQDVYLHSGVADSAYTRHEDLMACAWTVSYEKVVVRTLLKLDLSQLSPKTTILSAKLNLFGHNCNIQHGGHASMRASNKAVLHRVTESWNPAMVSWKNQPNYDLTDTIILPKSKDEFQDYTDIDITNWVKDMHRKPSNNHGLLLKIDQENVYTRMIFASGNHPDKYLRPYVEIITKSSRNEQLIFDLQTTFVHPLNQTKVKTEQEDIQEIEIDLAVIDAYESYKEPSSPEDVGIIVPASFSPNNDGKNDVLKIAYGSVYRFKFIVFNDDGLPVYRTSNPGFKWNGTQGGKKMPQGEYQWYLTGQDREGHEFNFLGTISIK